MADRKAPPTFGMSEKKSAGRMTGAGLQGTAHREMGPPQKKTPDQRSGVENEKDYENEKE